MNSEYTMSEHPGQKLKLLRESKGITLEQASQDTCLRRGLLQSLEDAPDDDLLPSVYRKLALRMYARYLGMECEMTRRATPASSASSTFPRIAPMRVYWRRMGRLPKLSKFDPAKRDHLLTIAKAASVAVVVVLGVGLWSLNAKISRLHFEENIPEPAAVLLSPEPETPPPIPQETVKVVHEPLPAPAASMLPSSLNLDTPITLELFICEK